VKRPSVCHICLNWRECEHLAVVVSAPIQDWSLPDGLSFASTNGPTYRFADICTDCKDDAAERMRAWVYCFDLDPCPLGECLLIETLDAEFIG
jgi:hypothetical protein